MAASAVACARMQLGLVPHWPASLQAFTGLDPLHGADQPHDVGACCALFLQYGGDVMAAAGALGAKQQSHSPTTVEAAAEAMAAWHPCPYPDGAGPYACIMAWQRLKPAQWRGWRG